MRINLTLRPEEERILSEAVEQTRKRGMPVTPTEVLRALFWVGIEAYRIQGELPRMLSLPRKVKTDLPRPESDADFERLFQIFATEHPKLVDTLINEYPQEYEQVLKEDDEEKFEEWVKEKFRLRKDYQAKVKPLTHQSNGE